MSLCPWDCHKLCRVVQSVCLVRHLSSQLVRPWHECSLKFFEEIICFVVECYGPSLSFIGVVLTLLFGRVLYFSQRTDHLSLHLHFSNNRGTFRVEQVFFRIILIETCVFQLQTFLHSLRYRISKFSTYFLYL